MVGVGGVSQASDWSKSNAVLRDLVNHTWPVYYSNGGEESSLSYYIAAYLLPAVIGKIFHSFKVAAIFILFYFAVGLTLLVLNAMFYIKIRNIRRMVIFMVGMFLFCGALMLAQNITYLFYPGINSMGSVHWLSGEGLQLQYRSILTDMRWVPMQFIFPSLAGVVFLRHSKDVRFYILFLLPTFLYSSFAFAGLAVMAVITALWYLFKKEISLKNIFSLSNIAITLSLGLIFVLYVWGNIKLEKPDDMSFGFVTYDGGRLLGVYFIFCIFMFGIHAVILWKRNRKNPIFISMIVVMIVLPFERMGVWNDWVMGCSIVPVFFLMLFVWEFILYEGAKEFGKGVLIVLLCIGAAYPIKEMTSAISTSIAKYQDTGRINGLSDNYGTMEKYANRSLLDEDGDEALIYNYYAYDLDDDIFYKYLARKRMG